MISAIVIILYTGMLLIASFWYLRVRYKLNDKKSWRKILKKHYKYLLLTAVILICILFIEVRYALKHDIYSLPVLMKWSTLVWGMYLLAKVDYHEKKIPNQIIAIMLLMRLGFLIYEILSNFEYRTLVLMYPVLGAVIGGIIMFTAMLVSRKGVGMGDVKMFIVIGAFVGSTEIIATMFYALMLSAIGGIILLCTRKAGLKDMMPMAPFACAGVIVKYWLLLMGG